jgi:hypothetical protein
MLSRLRRHITYANVMATIAVFLAMGGGAYALSLPNNSVRSRHIKNSQVKHPDLGANAVNAPKVRDESLTGSEIFNRSLTGSDVADDSLTGSQISESTLTGVERSSRTEYGRAATNSSSQTALISWPQLGVQVLNDGDTTMDSQIVVRNTRGSGSLHVSHSEDGTSHVIAAGGSQTFTKTGGLASHDLVIAAEPAADTSRALSVHCGYNFAPPGGLVHCFGTRSQAE